MDPLFSLLKIAGSGLEAQSTRLRIVSENIANARSTGDTPGADPYRRKTVTFGAEVDRASGADDRRDQELWESTIPISSWNSTRATRPPTTKGMVKLPNVNVLIEMADMREANRSYDANLQTIKQTRDLISATIDLLKSSQ